MRLRDLRKNPFLVAAAGWLVALVLRILGSSWRVKASGSDPFAHGDPVIVTIWHRNLFIAVHTWRDRGAVVPVSLSRDGDLIEGVLGRLGFGPPARGSSSRGAAGLLRQLIRSARTGRIVGVLPDGPRGPAREVKPGVVAVSRATGLPIVPVGVSAWPAIRFRSWDQPLLPLPFARVQCHYGTPLVVPKKASEAEREALRSRIEVELDRLTAKADSDVGLPQVVEHGRTR